MNGTAAHIAEIESARPLSSLGSVRDGRAQARPFAVQDRTQFVPRPITGTRICAQAVSPRAKCQTQRWLPEPRCGSRDGTARDVATTAERPAEPWQRAELLQVRSARNASTRPEPR